MSMDPVRVGGKPIVLQSRARRDLCCASIERSRSKTLSWRGCQYNPTMLRRIVLTLVTFLCLAGIPAAPAQQPSPQKATDTKTETVYVTRTGRRAGSPRFSRITWSITDIASDHLENTDAGAEFRKAGCWLRSAFCIFARHAQADCHRMSNMIDI
jgi:hypothetical protein